MRKYLNLRANIALGLIFAFLLNSLGPLPVYAQDFVLPAPGVMVHLSPAYTPAYLKGIVIHPENALKFDFLIDKGDGHLDENQKKEEYNKLIKYFLASLTVPDKDQWVNLSPYEKNRIIANDFGTTEMGRDLLGQDYLLKQITSSLMYPESGLGRAFWDKVYQRAYQEFGTTNIPVSTFNKVWIVPDEALIYQSGNTAYIVKSHLKVMLEEDYLSLVKHSSSAVTHTVASKVIKEIILPEIEREVNEGRNFAMLRQVFSGMLLATWYKKALKESLLGQVYADKAKVQGVNQDPRNNEEIYQRYLLAFKKGVYNFIKEDADKYSDQVVPRKYFAGGYVNDDAQITEVEKVPDNAMAASVGADKNQDLVTVVADPARSSDAAMLNFSRRAIILTAAAGIVLTATNSLAIESKTTPQVLKWNEFQEMIQAALQDQSIAHDNWRRGAIEALQQEPAEKLYYLKGTGLIDKLWAGRDNVVYKQMVFTILLKVGANILDQRARPGFYLRYARLSSRLDRLTDEELKAYIAMSVEIEFEGYKTALSYLIDADTQTNHMTEIFTLEDAEKDPLVKGYLNVYVLFLEFLEKVGRDNVPQNVEDLNIRALIYLMKLPEINSGMRNRLDRDLETQYRPLLGPDVMGRLYNMEHYDNSSLLAPLSFLGDPKYYGAQGKDKAMMNKTKYLPWAGSAVFIAVLLHLLTADVPDFTSSREGYVYFFILLSVAAVFMADFIGDHLSNDGHNAAMVAKKNKTQGTRMVEKPGQDGHIIELMNPSGAYIRMSKVFTYRSQAASFRDLLRESQSNDAVAYLVPVKRLPTSVKAVLAKLEIEIWKGKKINFLDIMEKYFKKGVIFTPYMEQYGMDDRISRNQPPYLILNEHEAGVFGVPEGTVIMRLYYFPPRAEMKYVETMIRAVIRSLMRYHITRNSVKLEQRAMSKERFEWLIRIWPFMFKAVNADKNTGDKKLQETRRFFEENRGPINDFIEDFTATFKKDFAMTAEKGKSDAAMPIGKNLPKIGIRFFLNVEEIKREKRERICNALVNVGVETVADLLEWRESDLITIPGLGSALITLLKQALAKYGWYLKGEFKNERTLDNKKPKEIEIQDFLRVAMKEKKSFQIIIGAVLEREGIKTVADLLDKKESDLMRVKSLNHGFIDLLKEALAKYGWYLKGSKEAIVLGEEKDAAMTNVEARVNALVDEIYLKFSDNIESDQITAFKYILKWFLEGNLAERDFKPRIVETLNRPSEADAIIKEAVEKRRELSAPQTDAAMVTFSRFVGRSKPLAVQADDALKAAKQAMQDPEALKRAQRELNKAIQLLQGYREFPQSKEFPKLREMERQKALVDAQMAKMVQVTDRVIGLPVEGTVTEFPVNKVLPVIRSMIGELDGAKVLNFGDQGWLVIIRNYLKFTDGDEIAQGILNFLRAQGAEYKFTAVSKISAGTEDAPQLQIQLSSREGKGLLIERLLALEKNIQADAAMGAGNVRSLLIRLFSLTLIAGTVYGISKAVNRSISKKRELKRGRIAISADGREIKNIMLRESLQSAPEEIGVGRLFEVKGHDDPHLNGIYTLYDIQNIQDEAVQLILEKEGSRMRLPIRLETKDKDHHYVLPEYLTISNDRAMVNGGIDMNAANFDLQVIKRDSSGVPLPVSEQDMAKLSLIKGFVPRILDIRPVVSVEK